MIACQTCGALLLETDEDRDMHTEWHNQQEPGGKFSPSISPRELAAIERVLRQSRTQMKKERRGSGLKAQLPPFLQARCKS